MKNFRLLLALALFVPTVAIVYGCGDDDNGSTPKPDAGLTDTGTGDAGTGDSGSQTPPPPTLGAQIDRLGRPAANTAVNHTFSADQTATDMAKDAYNADGTPSGWAAAFKDEIAANLAIYDGLDTTCGNQAFADIDGGTSATRYSTLAGVLADDRLWVNTGSATCSQYLGVELNATGVAPNTDCGGRTLAYDVIDQTYQLVGTANVLTDGVAADPAKTGGTTFPYLAAPK